MNIRDIDINKDSQILAEIHVDGLKAAYEGQVAKEYLNSLNKGVQEKKWREWLQNPDTTGFIAEKDGRIAGFIVFGRIRMPPPGQSAIRPLYSSEILGLYIREDYWGQDIGKDLLKEAALSLKKMKHTSLCLWVLDGNKRACAFYEKMGGQRVGKQKVEIGKRWVKEVCYGWRDTSKIISL